jgi:hypothetical protein
MRVEKEIAIFAVSADVSLEGGEVGVGSSQIRTMKRTWYPLILIFIGCTMYEYIQVEEICDVFSN